MSVPTNLSPDELRQAVDDSLPLAEGLFAELAERTAGEPGLTRVAYGEGEQIAHDLYAQTARNSGLEVTTDAAGNLYATLLGRDRAAPRWLSGSHLDTVLHGGNFDGAAGALAALTAVAALKRLGARPSVDLAAVAIRCEESASWFTGRHGGHLGSRAALGLLAADELDTAIHLVTGRTLAEHIDEAGFDSAAVRSGPPQLGPANVRAFVELHIEQGPVLEHEGRPLGIVTSIRGNVRARECRCLGAYAHSGATPTELRRDAVLATAELIGEIERASSRIRADGHDLVFTVGKISTDPDMHALSKVPGEVRFIVDIRSQDLATLEEMRELTERLGREIGARRGVAFTVGPFSLTRPAPMDPGMRRRLVEGAKALGIDALEMPCGAGHDAADFVNAGIPAAMIFVRNQGGSHNPDEAMTFADFADGVRLLTWFLANAG